MRKIYTFLESKFVTRNRFLIEINEFEPFLVNEGRIIVNHKIICNTFGGKAIIFAVKFENYDLFRKKFKKMNLPNKLPVQAGARTYLVTAINDGNTLLPESYIKLTSVSEFMMDEVNPAVTSIDIENFPLDQFEYRVALKSLAPGESARCVVSTEGAGIKNVKCRVNLPSNKYKEKIVRNHYYVRSIKDDSEILILDNKKIPLPEKVSKRNKMHLLNYPLKGWKEIGQW